MTIPSRVRTILSVLVLLGAPAHAGDRVEAEAEIFGCTADGVEGRLKLVEEKSEEGVKEVKVDLVVTGLPDGKHAVHIHETAACDPCGAAGGHFDPGPASFSSPDGNHPFHSGDLVNVEVKNGRGHMKTRTSRITLSPGPLSVFDHDGSAVIVHVNPDTYCDPPAPGCAGGARAACGILELGG